LKISFVLIENQFYSPLKQQQKRHSDIPRSPSRPSSKRGVSRSGLNAYGVPLKTVNMASAKIAADKENIFDGDKIKVCVRKRPLNSKVFLT
jgi:hypothetical protein